MPPRSIKYVWSITLPVGTVAESPYSKKAKIVVLRSGSGGVGEWIDERVNVLEDFRRLFGENEVPRVRGIGILTDSDNTASTSAGDYRSLRFSREEEEVAVLQSPHRLLRVSRRKHVVQLPVQDQRGDIDRSEPVERRQVTECRTAQGCRQIGVRGEADLVEDRIEQRSAGSGVWSWSR